MSGIEGNTSGPDHFVLEIDASGQSCEAPIVRRNSETIPTLE